VQELLVDAGLYPRMLDLIDSLPLRALWESFSER
jgi:hypothetical protein